MNIVNSFVKKTEYKPTVKGIFLGTFHRLCFFVGDSIIIGLVGIV